MTINRYLFGSAVLAALVLSACGGSYQHGGSAAAPDFALAATVRAARLATPASLTRPDTPAAFMVAPAAAAPEPAPATLTVASAPAAAAAARTLAISVPEPAPAAPTAPSVSAAPTSAPAASTPARMPTVVRVAAAPAVSAPEFASAALTAAPMPAALVPAPAALRVPAPQAYVQHAYASAPAPAVARSTSAPAPTPVAAEQNAEPAAAAATRRCCNTSALFAAARLAVRTRTAEVAAARERLREVKKQDTVARKAVRAKTAEVAATRDRLRQAQAAVRDLLALARADRSRRPELLDARRARDDAGSRLRAAREAAAAAWAERNRMLVKVAEHAERLRQAEEALRAAEAAAARNAELRWNPRTTNGDWYAKYLANEGHEVELALRLRAYDTVIESAGVIVRDVDNGLNRTMLGQVGRHLFGIHITRMKSGRVYGYWYFGHGHEAKKGYIHEAPTISGTWEGAAVAYFEEYEYRGGRRITSRTTTQGGPATLEYDGATDRVTTTIDLSAHPRGAKFITTAARDIGWYQNMYDFEYRDGSQIVGNSVFHTDGHILFYKEPPDGSVAIGSFHIDERLRQVPKSLRWSDILGVWRGEFGVRRVEEPAE